MPKTILHIIDSLQIGGAESLLVNSVVSLDNYENIIVTLLPCNQFSKELTGFKVITLNYKGMWDIITCAIRLREIIFKYKADIIHSHLFWSTVVARLAYMFLNVKLIFSVHTVMSHDSFNNSRFMALVEKLTYTSRQILIGVSKTVLVDYNETIGIKGRHFVLYNFIKDAFFYKKRREAVNFTAPKTIRLVAVGNLKPVKNYNFLLDAFSELDRSRFSLDIYGDGNEKGNLQKIISKNHLNVCIKGQISKLEDVLPHYDIFIMPSKSEGFGLVLLEAMAIGLPLLLSDIPVFRELAEEHAFFFDHNDPEDMVKKMFELIDGTCDIGYKVDRARRKAGLIARKDKYIKALCEIYEK